MYSPESQEEEERQLENDMDKIAEFCKAENEFVDFAGRIVWAAVKGADGLPLLNPDGTVRMQEVFNFGKYKDRSVAEVLRHDPGYYSWILSSDFTLNTKQVLTRIRLREYNNQNRR
jgi:DNA polymerase-3 subunit epsilon